MINISDKTKCCGCTACYNICQHNAIVMKEDKEGFWYPIINEHNCIQCGMCERVCPYLNAVRPKTDLKKAYTAINTDEVIRSKSSSGGMFSVFANQILLEGGVVFGAAYDDEWLVYHKSIDKEQDIVQLIGSKYMQSRLDDTFKRVRIFLKESRTVLFVGTTCQINGLKNYLIVEYANLYTIDFICLGVPSPKIWKDYIDTFFDRKNIKYINFKDKTLGWHNFSLHISGNDFDFCKSGKETYYFNGYFRHIYTRPSCANCVSKLGNRMSDITISDCWGYDVIAPELDDNKGMSSVVCHTQKGLELFNRCKDGIIWKEGKLADILKFNSGYRNSVPQSEKYNDFWIDYNKLDKKKLFKKYCSIEKTDIFHRGLRKIRKSFK